MTDPKIQTVQTIYEAFGRGDVNAVLALVTDDVDWASEPDSTIAPWHGRRQGKDEVARFFAELGGVLEVHEFRPLTFAANDTEVLDVVRFDITSRTTGRRGAMDLHHWWGFRDGLVSWYRGTEHTALTASLLAPVASPV